MDDLISEEDRIAIASLVDAPPPYKAQYYRHQLRARGSGMRSHVRKHSLDEDRFHSMNDPTYIDSDDDFFPYAAATTGKASSTRLDQTLASSSSHSQPLPLPEFVAAGGGSKNFRVPVRAAVHPNRPPCLEIRPHPLRETQAGKFLRTFACTESQLWAGQESGIRVWNLSKVYETGIGIGGSRFRRGDEEAAPFYESVNTSPTLRVMVDSANRLVWSGHKDGRIKSWKMDQPMGDLPFKEGLSWQAHRSPLLAMTITSYGDIWTGSEGGAIRFWPWESIEKSLRMSSSERHMAALLVERSCLDLRSQVTLNNGVCILSSSDVKFLLSDTVKSKVWCASSSSFSLWDARTRELLKVFNVDGQIENRVDLSLVQEQAGDDEMKVKFVSSSKREKSQGPSFLQRSRIALMGAADVVRRVATKGASAFVEDKRTEALVQSNDGMIWSGCSNGLLVQWDGSGNRLKDFNHHACAIQCFCALGTRIYVGYVSGVIQIVDLQGNMIAGWVAHNNPILKLAVGNNFIFSLAAHGGLRGWSIISPGPLDNVIRTELARKEVIYTRLESFGILVGTWNVGQGRAPYDSLMSWLGSHVSDVGIVVVGLQEVGMGAGFLAMSAAKETVGLEGSSVGQWWQDAIGKSLDEGSTFERIGSRQLAGLLIAMWVRRDLRRHVGDIDAGAVPCGFGRAIGNKGAVGLRIRVYDRTICFVNCHFAAHLEAVGRRNADFDYVYRNMVFNRPNLQSVTAVGVSSTAQLLGSKAVAGVNPEDAKPELSEADMMVFLGDLNYRLNNISYDESRDFVSQRCFDWLREKDQLRAEMKAGRVFQGMREAVVRFPPTYKFERNQPGLGGYDCGEKKRIPAWCDRILFRDTQTGSSSQCSLECPVVASVLEYEGCMDVTESDHKPVRCKLNIEVARVDRSVRRREFGEIVRGNVLVSGMVDEMSSVPAAALSTDVIMLEKGEEGTFHITNKSGRSGIAFRIVCEGQVVVKDEGDEHRVRAAFAFPTWLEVLPGGGVIEPENVAEVCVRHVEVQEGSEGGGVPQTWWNEDTRDKEVILGVQVHGIHSPVTETHTLRVLHSPSSIPNPLLHQIKSPPPGRMFL